MNTTLSKLGFAVGAALFAAACGGNVIIDSGSGAGGAGGTTETITNACQHYAEKLVAKYAECGIEVNIGGSGGSAICSASDTALASCLEGCLQYVDCACTVDPSPPGCSDKLKPYTDCISACVN